MKFILLAGLLVLAEASLASNINQFFPSGGGGGGGTLSIDQLLAKLPTIDSGNTSNINVSDLADLNTLFNSGSGMAAVAASSTNMNLVVNSATAMTSIAASSTAMASLCYSSSAIGVLFGSSIARTAIFNNSIAVNQIVASTLAVSILVANTTAMAAFAASPVSISVLNSNASARNLFYTYATKFNKNAGDYWGYVHSVRSGNGLFIRSTTFGNPAGWSEGNMTTTYLQYNGSINVYQKNTAVNPYVQLNEQPVRAFTSLSLYEYNPLEIAYIPY